MAKQDHQRRRGRGRLGSIGRGVVVCMAGIALLGAGCSQRRDGGTATQPAAPAAAEDLSAVANNVDVTLTADAIAMPEIISSGWTNFVIRNGDRVAHRFAIQGQGVDRMLPDEIQPGETQQMRVQLRPGDYQVSMPRGGTTMTGVSRRVTVARW